MFRTKQQILLIESSTKTIAEIIQSLSAASMSIEFEFDIAADVSTAVELLKTPSPSRLILVNPWALENSESGNTLNEGLCPVIAYATSPDDYPKLLELNGMFERLLLTSAVLRKLPELIAQWWYRWQLQQSRAASVLQLLNIQKLTESLNIGTCVVGRNRDIQWANAVVEQLLAEISSESGEANRIPAPAAATGVSPVEIVRAIRRHGRWTGELTGECSSLSCLSITATCHQNSAGRITGFSILAQTITDSPYERPSMTMADQRSAARSRLDRLSPREREVLQLVTAGYSNIQMATRLGISSKTIEKHRGRLMKKVVAESLAELVQMVVTVNGGPTISLQETESRPSESQTPERRDSLPSRRRENCHPDAAPLIHR